MAILQPSLDYTPHGSAKHLFESRDFEIVLSGPAGTGKSLACLWKLHFCATHIPKFRGLIFRKTREALTESALVTFERDVLPPNHPAARGAGRKLRQVYEYPNGAEIVVGGLDKPQKIMSTEYDMAYGQEAIELTEDAWESIGIRLRNGKLPYQQLLADTNPDRPTHWLKKRADQGRTRMLNTRHEDNPRLYDRAKQTWTAEGVRYIGILDALTGPRKPRLRHGLWVQAEGIVYEGWDPAVHLLDPFPIQAAWPRYWSIDFGFTNPFVCQFWALDPDGRLHLYREIYKTQTLVEDHAKRIRALCGLGGDVADWTKASEPRPRVVICDHDAEDRATLERHLKLPTTAAVKEVSPGVQNVAARLRPAGDGKPRLFVHRGALDQRDKALDERKLPACTAEEVEGYCWSTGGGRKSGEEPVKENDHGCDSLRYLVHYLDHRTAKPVFAPQSAGGQLAVNLLPKGAR